MKNISQYTFYMQTNTWQDTAGITAMLTGHSKYSRSIYDTDNFYLQKLMSSKPIELSEHTKENQNGRVTSHTYTNWV